MAVTESPTFLPSSGPVPCAEHPDVETRLRCSRCGKPICPRCAVRTPVGMRCPDCAGTRALVKADPRGVAIAAGAGLVVAALVGIGWGFFPDWEFYWALLLGFGVVEVIARLLPARQGADLQAIAIAIVVFGVVLSRVILAQRLGIDVARVNDFSPRLQHALYLRPIPDLIFAALPVLIGWYRFR
jgi:DNA-directed RNA polymerase subunit RPC12/RpoP